MNRNMVLKYIFRSPSSLFFALSRDGYLVDIASFLILIADYIVRIHRELHARYRPEEIRYGCLVRVNRWRSV